MGKKIMGRKWFHCVFSLHCVKKKKNMIMAANSFIAKWTIKKPFAGGSMQFAQHHCITYILMAIMYSKFKFKSST